VATLVEEGDLEEGENGGGVGKEGAESDTSSAEFVVATLMVITSVLTHALDRHQTHVYRPCDLRGRRLWPTQAFRPWTQRVRMTGEQCLPDQSDGHSFRYQYKT